MNPRDPSSVDDEIDLRGSGSEADDPEVVVDGLDGLDGPDPDNPFSLGPGAGPRTALPHAAPPPAGTIRRRKDVGEARPLGPGPIPGPLAGAGGSLDLAEVHPADEVAAGPEFLPPEPPRQRAGSIVILVVAAVAVIAIGTGVGAALASAGAPGWASALVVSTVCVALAALVWRWRRN